MEENKNIIQGVSKDLENFGNDGNLDSVETNKKLDQDIIDEVEKQDISKFLNNEKNEDKIIEKRKNIINQEHIQGKKEKQQHTIPFNFEKTKNKEEQQIKKQIQNQVYEGKTENITFSGGDKKTTVIQDTTNIGGDQKTNIIQEGKKENIQNSTVIQGGSTFVQEGKKEHITVENMIQNNKKEQNYEGIKTTFQNEEKKRQEIKSNDEIQKKNNENISVTNTTFQNSQSLGGDVIINEEDKQHTGGSKVEINHKNVGKKEIINEHEIFSQQDQLDQIEHNKKIEKHIQQNGNEIHSEIGNKTDLNSINIEVKNEKTQEGEKKGNIDGFTEQKSVEKVQIFEKETKQEGIKESDVQNLSPELQQEQEETGILGKLQNNLDSINEVIEQEKEKKRKTHGFLSNDQQKRFEEMKKQLKEGSEGYTIIQKVLTENTTKNLTTQEKLLLKKELSGLGDNFYELNKESQRKSIQESGQFVQQRVSSDSIASSQEYQQFAGIRDTLSYFDFSLSKTVIITFTLGYGFLSACYVVLYIISSKGGFDLSLGGFGGLIFGFFLLIVLWMLSGNNKNEDTQKNE